MSLTIANQLDSIMAALHTTETIYGNSNNSSKEKENENIDDDGSTKEAETAATISTKDESSSSHLPSSSSSSSSSMEEEKEEEKGGGIKAPPPSPIQRHLFQSSSSVSDSSSRFSFDFGDDNIGSGDDGSLVVSGLSSSHRRRQLPTMAETSFTSTGAILGSFRHKLMNGWDTDEESKGDEDDEDHWIVSGGGGGGGGRTMEYGIIDVPSSKITSSSRCLDGCRETEEGEEEYVGETTTTTTTTTSLPSLPLPPQPLRRPPQLQPLLIVPPEKNYPSTISF